MTNYGAGFDSWPKNQESDLLAAVRNEPKAYAQVIFTYKTTRCQDKKWKEQTQNYKMWIGYHSDQEIRRVPIKNDGLQYSEELCPNVKNEQEWISQTTCSFAHNNLEINFHPIKFKTQEWILEKENKCMLGIYWSNVHSNEIKRDGKAYYKVLFNQSRNNDANEGKFEENGNQHQGHSNLLNQVKSPPRSLNSWYKNYAHERQSFN